MEELNKTIECMENQLKELKKIRDDGKEEQDRWEEYDKRMEKIENDIAKIRDAII